MDEYVLYVAPMLLGPGRGLAALAPLSELTQSVKLEFKSTQMIGADLRIIARGAGRDQF